MICEADSPVWRKTASQCRTATEQTADCWMTASRDATVQTHTRSLMHQQKKHSIPFCNPRSPWSLSVISPYCSSSSLYWHMAASQSPFSLHRQQKVSNCSICLGSPLSITMLVSFSLLCFCIFWSKRCPVLLYFNSLLCYRFSFVLCLLFRLLDCKLAEFYCTPSQ